MCCLKKTLPFLILVGFLGGQVVSDDFSMFVSRNDGVVGAGFLALFFGSLFNALRVK